MGLLDVNMRRKTELSVKERRIVGFCIKLIQERRKISVEEIYEAAKKEFPQYSFTRKWLSRRIKETAPSNIVKWRVKNKKLFFGFEEERIKHYKRCLYCGKPIPGNFVKWCSSKCYEELEKIATWYSPMPNLPSQERVREILGVSEPQREDVSYDTSSSQHVQKRLVVLQP